MQDLRKDSDELIVDKLTALETWLLETLDLLLDDDLESGRSDEKRRCRSLHIHQRIEIPSQLLAGAFKIEMEMEL